MTAGAVVVPTIVPLRAPQAGKSKNDIDSNTKVEIKSSTANTDIYYTLDGTKPNPFQPIGGGVKSTMKYKSPIFLAAGKQTVKAVAVTRDGCRESGVVTKMFQVEFVKPPTPPPDDDEDNFQDEVSSIDRHNTSGIGFSARKHSKSLISKILAETGGFSEEERRRQATNMMTDMTISGARRHKPPTGPRFMNSRLGPASDRATIGQDTVADLSMVDHTMSNGHHYMPEDPVVSPERRRPPVTASQSLRLQRETDFLKCVYCFKPRPADPFARFCLECGNPVPPIPQNRLPPPEAGQMGLCVHCKSVVPFTVATCLVCEAPIPPQHIPQASIRLKDKAVCVVCGTANPINMSTCVTCEARLPTDAKPIYSGISAPPMPSQAGRLLSCTKCGRVNNSDARFCDWCGAKPAPPTTTLTCSRCGASNQPYATYCGTCGVKIEPPPRIDPRNGGLSVALSDITTPDPQWLPVAIPGPGQMIPPKEMFTESPRVEVVSVHVQTKYIHTKSMSTQTVGLFYPSEREILKKRDEEEDRLAMEREARDRKPLLTAISPGRGYWRKQVEHITSHLKAHAVNNAEFRALIGEPRMGKLVSAFVQEDGYELNLSISFALKGHSDPFNGNSVHVSRGDTLSRHTRNDRPPIHRYASMDSLATDRTDGSNISNSSTRRKKKKVVKKSKKNKDEKEDERSEEDKKLVREVGKNGEGRISEIEALLEEGADIKTTSKTGMPLLHMAAINKHVDAIEALVKAGADIDRKGPNKGNSALHEAVSLGHAGREVVEALLRSGANPSRKNEKGETAYDLAVQGGYDGLANKLASSLGQSQLDKMIRPRATTNNEF